MFILLSIVFCALGATMVEETGIWIFAASQAMLLLGEIFRRTLSGTGGFIFMSFLFFGVRPIYIIVEQDYSLITGLFRLYPDFAQIHENALMATVALIIFKIGSLFVSSGSSPNQPTNNQQPATTNQQPTTKTPTLVSAHLASLLIVYQIVTLPVMQYLAAGGRALYGSALGAFAYDFPTVMQAGHIFGFVVILERYLQRRGSGELFQTIVSGLIFLFFTWLMREVSMFRGFYLAGVMIVGIAALDRILPRVSLLWLILPILLFQPVFQKLGSTRYLDNEALKEAELVDEAFDDSDQNAYWRFYSGKGDMNIFDTFVAARNSQPAVTPYAWSWIYAPLHVIPRALWSGKPEKGVTQDLRFMFGAPYAPGIAGFFWLDGGSDFWMFASMFALGLVLGFADRYILGMPNGYLRACFLAIITVNAMFLTRFFLWQALWQIMYAAVPVILLYYFLARNDSETSNETSQADYSKKGTAGLYS